MNQTETYGLSQWVKEDRILREDFNADNAKIEAAILAANEAAAAATAAVSVPTHAVGLLSDYDGSADVTVNLGRQPKMVIIGNRNGFTNIITGSSSFAHPGHAVAMPDMPGLKSNHSIVGTKETILEVTETGFTLKAGFESLLSPFYYLALF